MPEPPRVETERLVLRGLREDDLDRYAEWCADPDVMRFLGGPVDRVGAWRSLAVHLGHWRLRGYGQWAVERARDGLLLGRVGLWNPEGWPGLELGWTLARDVWGHGYATEAAAASIAWARAELDGAEPISLIDPENGGSVAVAERLGMRPVREIVLMEKPATVYAVTLDAADA